MIRVFADTNIFSEFIEKRACFEDVQELFHRAVDNEIEIYLSVGSLYTICYLSERAVKRLGIHKPKQTRIIRLILTKILRMSHLVSLDQEDAQSGALDEHFDDLEDSFQYQCALSSSCDYLLTINVKDFRGADENKINVVSPSELLQILNKR